jgi:hypothetical protein
MRRLALIERIGGNCPGDLASNAAANSSSVQTAVAVSCVVMERYGHVEGNRDVGTDEWACWQVVSLDECRGQVSLLIIGTA